MTKDELVEAFKQLPFNEMTKLMAKNYAPLEVDELPSLPNKFTFKGSNVAYSTTEDWEAKSNCEDIVYYANVTVEPIDKDTIVLSKNTTIAGNKLIKVYLTNEGYCYVILERGKQLL